MVQQSDPQNKGLHYSLFDIFTDQSLNGKSFKSTPEKFRQITSVINYLQLTFNIRQGSTVSNPDYGLPDFPSIHVRIPEDIGTYAEIIERCILKYEPRIKNAQIIKWGINKKTYNLYCIIFITLVTSKTFRLKCTLQGIGKNTLELAFPDHEGSD